MTPDTCFMSKTTLQTKINYMALSYNAEFNGLRISAGSIMTSEKRLDGSAY